MFDDFEALWALRQSGRWWDNPWWRDSIYLTEFGLQAEQVEAAFQALREVFDEKWTKAQGDNRHPMLSELFGTSGLSPFSFLYELGKGLSALHQNRLLGDLPRRLREIDEFEGACAEVSALAQWAQAGVKIERNIPSGNGNQNCDWKVSDGTAVIFGEVKRIWPARNNSERSDLGEFILGNVLERLGADGICGEFRMELRIRPENVTETWNFKRITAEIADKVVGHLKANRGKETLDWQIVEGLAKYFYVPGVEPEGLHGGFGGIPYNMRDEADKIMDVVETASDQIPMPGPGIVMISGGGRASGLPFSHEAGERIIERFKMPNKRCAHIAGVLIEKLLLVPGEGLVRLAVFVANPTGPELNLGLLKKGFPEVEIWKPA